MTVGQWEKPAGAIRLVRQWCITTHQEEMRAVAAPVHRSVIGGLVCAIGLVGYQSPPEAALVPQTLADTSWLEQRRGAQLRTVDDFEVFID